MSQIEDLVVNALCKEAELKPIDRGFLWNRHPHETRIQFLPLEPPVSTSGVSFGLSATCIIETIFDGQFTGDDYFLARLNKRSCWGNFFSENQRLGMRATYCIYDKEPAAHWVARTLLRAFGEQIALGFAIAQSELSPNSLAANRANLEYPRQWAALVDPAILASAAQTFRNRDFASASGHLSFTVEVPLSPGQFLPRRPIRRRDGPPLRLHRRPAPLAGVGYCGTIALPFDPPPSAIPTWCKVLNDAEHHLHDFVPRIGAWGLRSANNQITYALFYPTNEPDAGVPSMIMNWLVTRMIWGPQRILDFR